MEQGNEFGLRNWHAQIIGVYFQFVGKVVKTYLKMFVWFDLTPIKLEEKEILEAKHASFRYYTLT